MLYKTHLAITIAALLLFLPKIEFSLITYFTVAIIATLLPDVDSAFSKLGKQKATVVVRFFTKHRGIFHSITFGVVVSAILAYTYPTFAFPFFLGYSLHIFADAFTIEGIAPFWPSKKMATGNITVGGKFERIFFYVFVIIDAFLFVFLFV